ncbi:MAG: hypothetical protein ACW967_04335 [Candidatus Hodarchaeales archaeon]
MNLYADDSAEDLDNDGLTNLQEYLLKKNPHTPDSDIIVETTTVTETSTIPPSTITTTVPDTTTETSTTVETSFATIISQIVETITKTTESFGIVFICMGMLGLIFLRRKRSLK